MTKCKMLRHSSSKSVEVQHQRPQDNSTPATAGWYNSSLTDQGQAAELREFFVNVSNIINKTLKLWCLKFGVFATHKVALLSIKLLFQRWRIRNKTAGKWFGVPH